MVKARQGEKETAFQIDGDDLKVEKERTFLEGWG